MLQPGSFAPPQSNIQFKSSQLRQMEGKELKEDSLMDQPSSIQKSSHTLK